MSVVYTFTYESVKTYLVPLLPQEYCSVAHCTAGGCASIATFIFTPSELIKQQMQYIKRLAGWGDFLCRNIQHSVIKVGSFSMKDIKFTFDSLNGIFHFCYIYYVLFIRTMSFQFPFAFFTCDIK
ncbi:hypothetical protein MKX01_008747 [Papaver californicum]|nr:hypothetical protein MKX01_008747 [Papaver californicum]